MQLTYQNSFLDSSNHIDFYEVAAAKAKVKSSFVSYGALAYVLAAILSEIWMIRNLANIPNHCYLHFQSSVQFSSCNSKVHDKF